MMEKLEEYFYDQMKEKIREQEKGQNIVRQEKLVFMSHINTNQISAINSKSILNLEPGS